MNNSKFFRSVALCFLSLSSLDSAAEMQLQYSGNTCLTFVNKASAFLSCEDTGAEWRYIDQSHQLVFRDNRCLTYAGGGKLTLSRCDRSDNQAWRYQYHRLEFLPNPWNVPSGACFQRKRDGTFSASMCASPEARLWNVPKVAPAWPGKRNSGWVAKLRDNNRSIIAINTFTLLGRSAFDSIWKASQSPAKTIKYRDDYARLLRGLRRSDDFAGEAVIAVTAATIGAVATTAVSGALAAGGTALVMGTIFVPLLAATVDQYTVIHVANLSRHDLTLAGTYFETGRYVQDARGRDIKPVTIARAQPAMTRFKKEPTVSVGQFNMASKEMTLYGNAGAIRLHGSDGKIYLVGWANPYGGENTCAVRTGDMDLNQFYDAEIEPYDSENRGRVTGRDGNVSRAITCAVSARDDNALFMLVTVTQDTRAKPWWQ